jgi:hypothetical protein
MRLPALTTIYRWFVHRARIAHASAAIGIMHPATATRFLSFRPNAQLVYLMAAPGWMFRFALVCMAAIIATTSFEALSTELLPRWIAWAGLMVALAAILRLA